MGAGVGFDLFSSICINLFSQYAIHVFFHVHLTSPNKDTYFVPKIFVFIYVCMCIILITGE